jgi:DNA gyrase subunit A
MGRGTAGVRGMNVSQKGNRVLALNVARDDSELLVITENGFGKRTALSDYPIKNRGTKGVLTAKLTEAKGGLAGALIVKDHQELLFITENGMVQRTSVAGIRKTGRATQGVKAMNVREGDHISAVALVVESAEPDVSDIDGEAGETVDAEIELGETGEATETGEADASPESTDGDAPEDPSGD